MAGIKLNLRKFLKEVAKAKIKAPDPSDSPWHPSTPNNADRNFLTQGNLHAWGSGSPMGTAKLKASEPADPFLQARSDGNLATLDNPFGFGSPLHAYTSYSPAGSAKMAGYGDADSLFGDDVDSLFGDPLDTPSVKDQEMQVQLEQLLAQGTPQKPAVRFTESFGLQDLKEDLKKLVFLETGGRLTARERSLVERHKGPLIEEIRYTGEVERKAYEYRTKGNMNFPEPIGHDEKQRMEKDKQRLKKARAKAAEGPPKLRRTQQQLQEDRDNENELDGEERLRLGKRLKTKPFETTGYFRSTKHDYFPGIPGAKKAVTDSGGERILEPTLRDFSPEARKLRRRELADLGEALAKADRRMKGLGR